MDYKVHLNEMNLKSKNIMTKSLKGSLKPNDLSLPEFFELFSFYGSNDFLFFRFLLSGRINNPPNSTANAKPPSKWKDAF